MVTYSNKSTEEYSFLSPQEIKNNPDIIRIRTQEIQQKFGLQLNIGAEIEFYLLDEKILGELEKQISICINPEKGKKQFEISLKHTDNILSLGHQIVYTRDKIKEVTTKLGSRVFFSPKPYDEDFGNAMHFHVDLVPLPYTKTKIENEFIAQILCHFLHKTIHFFLQTPQDYKRLDHKFMAPTHICYGNNNRTVAIRIPDSFPKRVEHRLPSANADPFVSLYAITESIWLGLNNPKTIKNHVKIYGNAFDKQYEKLLIPIGDLFDYYNY